MQGREEEGYKEHQFAQWIWQAEHQSSLRGLVVQMSLGILGGMWSQVPHSGRWLPPLEWGKFNALLCWASRVRPQWCQPH